ncbi:O-acetyl-ADP-ribose deacetylase (regulator of RNase III), contains Macro domain [Propionispira arboris]|uniref:O-acetyl-ADP-ribose deacetylase (Regulator of RNase III), contains Macro domain n=1 Tax=Propionispira arboris TaxID=84035 RepID=A0A1H6UNY7_9FIRM|nr:macro domain-containing protein [Propionispira arboris]SEI94019.1 O-acetyl-ADP-ribose deacetylase (regulator of RNase III), contains Macro domain [Propionispira arboris]
MNTIDKIEIVHGNIVDIVRKHDVEMIVNAAKRTLMGGSGVDGAIHQAIDDLNNKTGFFKEMIKDELDGNNPKKDEFNRCDYGKAIVTKGYKLVDYVIHAVGPKWDGNYNKNGGSCSKSCIDKLKGCYESVLDCMMEYGCNTIAIPVISSGSYRFPFEKAAKIQFVSICNFLTRLKKKDPERFGMINKIYIVVFSQDDIKCFENIKNEYAGCVNKGKQLLYLSTEESYKAYLKDINDYDSERRNYFGTIKFLRKVLMMSEKFFYCTYFLKRCFADKTWEGRRIFIESQTIIKALIPLFFLVFTSLDISPYVNSDTSIWIRNIFTGVSIYLMSETLIYVAKLLFLSDILNPSANSIRSIFFLFINYLDINFTFAFLYSLYGDFKEKGGVASLYEAFEHSSQVPGSQLGMTLVILQNCITLYLIGIVFTYFVNSFRTRKFNSI